LQRQTGAAAPAPLRHCATWGEAHDTSQRLPSLSALHEVVPLAVEFVTVVVLPVFDELVTLDEFVEFTELFTFAELLESFELVASEDVTLLAEPHAHSASANTVTRYLIVECSNGCRGELQLPCRTRTSAAAARAPCSDAALRANSFLRCSSQRE
jgi:hypothetical protein